MEEAKLFSRFLLAILGILALLLLLAGCSSTAAGDPLYHCPMHPQVISEKPGACPICGMDLVMQPPGAPVPPEGSPSAGLAPVEISAGRRALMGLATSVVEKRDLTREVRTPARIVPDETRLYHVTAKLDGYIEELFVNATGQSVKRGQPLLTIYSPDLVASQQELLTALAASRRLGRSPYPSIAEGGQDLVDAARRRLKLWDIRDSQIARIEATGQVERTLTLFAPASGHVFEKRVVAGHKTVSGETLLTLADLSTVWAEADVYESDLPFVKVGMPASMTVSHLSGRPFPGRIAFLNPFLDPRSRTLKARMEIPNPGLLLKPEMYGEVTLSFGLGKRLAVPETAVLPKGKKNLVFVETVPGTFTPTEVTLGIRSAGYFEVLSGLDEGDAVVTSANFLVDSESSLRDALRAAEKD